MLDVTTGIAEPIAGTGVEGHTGDGGSALRARIHSPYGIAASYTDMVYISERDAHTIRRVDMATKIITTVIGRPYSPGIKGDRDLAVDAQLNSPHGVTIDSNGYLWVCRVANN